MVKCILASGSPRRKEILEQAGIDFEILLTEHEEYSELLEPEAFVKELALKKAEAAADMIEKKQAENIENGQNKKTIIIGADTVVVQNHTILGKPIDHEAAFSMLNSLQGKAHQVFTGVAVIVLKNECREKFCFAEETLVKVCPMEPEEIHKYILTKEPMDKAGGYAIQGRFGRYIEGITGDYYNVVGFPISRFCREMKNKGLLDNIMITC